MNNQQTISNNSITYQVVEDPAYDQEEDKDIEQYTQQLNLKQLQKNQDSLMQQINLLNEEATLKFNQQKYNEALKLLQQSEQMLEFAASCGQVIDRNLIIIILYNQACTYQCQWVLDKCSKYLDGVIYNMELAVKEDEQDLQNFTNVQEKQVQLVKRYTFLAKAYLQYTAILSQIGKHNKALINSQKAASIMRELFKIANQFCQQQLQSNGSQGTATTSQSNISIKSNKQEQQDQDKQKRGQKYRIKDEIEFSRLVIDGAQDILKDMIRQVELEKIPLNEKQLLKEAKKQLYYWRNNPENNEKHLRKELKLVSQNEEYRSLLGIQNLTEWIKNFNIGSIMHMIPQLYDDFTQYGEMIYELAKRQILEKVIYFSISYFTIATELRFVELEKAKLIGLKEDKIDTEEYKLGELYHLKSIEIACRHITTQSPYISHLITSYHKHYNINLDIIKEESILSSTSEKQVIVKTETIQIQKPFQQKLQIQYHNDNKNIDKQDKSPKLTNYFITNFLNSRSPPKTQQQSKIKSIIKNQTDLIEQMINQKRGSNYSPSNQQNYIKQQNQGQFDYSMYLKSNICNTTSNNKINLTQDFINNTMTIQLQPHKNNPNFRSNPISQQSPTNKNSKLKSLLSDVCRTERHSAIDKQNSHTPISYRVNNGSPNSSYTNYQKLKQQQVNLNKTPQNRPRTNIEQQQLCFPFKFETIQSLLKNKGNIQKQK